MRKLSPILGAHAGGAWEDYAAAVQGLAAAQRAAERLEWLGCAKIALQVAPALCALPCLETWWFGALPALHITCPCAVIACMRRSGECIKGRWLYHST